MAEAIYIRLPTISGGWERRQIDPDRLGLSTLSTLYVRTKSAGNDLHFMPVFGCVDVATSTFDTSVLAQKIDEVLASTRASVESNSEQTASLVLPLLDHVSRLREVFALIGSGRVDEADHVLTGILWDINGVAVDVAGSVESTSMEVSASESIRKSWETTTTLTDDIRRAYVSWDKAASDVHGAIELLEGIENQLDMLAQEAQARVVQWEQRSGHAQGLYAEAVAFLDDPQGTGADCFTNRAIAYTRHPERFERADIEKDIARAHDHIRLISGELETMTSVWDEARTSMVERSLVLMEEIDWVAERLEQGRASFIEMRDRLFDGKLKPYEIPNPIGTKSEFVRVEESLGQTQWVPRRVRARLKEHAGSLPHQIGTAPVLPDVLRRAISMTERQIAVIENDWTLLDQARPQTEDLGFEMPSFAGFGFSPDVDSGHDEDVADVSALPAAHSADANRTNGHVVDAVIAPVLPHVEALVDTGLLRTQATLQQVYELVFCVGYVLTCNEKPYAWTNVGTLGRIVKQLDIVENGVVDGHFRSLESFIMQSQNCEMISEDRDRAEAWRQSVTYWLCLEKPFGNHRHLRVSQCAKVMCIRLMKKYSLTANKVKHAKRAVKTADKARRRNRNSGASRR